MTRTRHIFQRIGLAVAVGAVAMLCLSSGTLAAIVGVAVAVAVAVDTLAVSREPPQPRSDPPDTLSVDLSRRLPRRQ